MLMADWLHSSTISSRLRAIPVRSDRNVVLVDFGSYAVEVIPGFELVDGRFQIPDSAAGGKYKATDYNAQTAAVSVADQASNGNTRDLIRMMKCWQGYCIVPIKSFWIELLAMEFIAQWQHRGHSTVYHDWLVRDFLASLKGKRGAYLFAPGTYEIICLGDEWHSRTESAHGRADKACQHESANMPYAASAEWKRSSVSTFPTREVP